MSSSVDYRVFCEASARELERLTRVYMGAEDDEAPAAEHLVVDHLDALLSGPLTPALRTLYMQEYSEMRAALRAAAITSLSRRDYYLDATATATYGASQLRDALAFNEMVATGLVNALDSDSQKTLADLESEYIDRKNEVIDRLEAESGFSGEDGPTIEDVLRSSMQGKPGVNNKGVSTTVPRYV